MAYKVQTAKRTPTAVGQAQRDPLEFRFATRSAEEYFKTLHLPDDEEYFRGKIIFDVGSGYSSFAEYMERRYLDCKVVSIEPQIFSSPLNEKEKPSGIVAARAEEMPFKGACADEILASWSVPLYSRNDYEALRGIYEMLRCLKAGGLLKITPFKHPETFNEGIGDLGLIITAKGSRVLRRLLQEGNFSTSFHQYEETVDPDYPELSYTFIIRKKPNSSLEGFKEYLMENRGNLESQVTSWAKRFR